MPADAELELAMPLQASCLMVSCGSASTCVQGACQATDVDVTTLPPFKGN